MIESKHIYLKDMAWPEIKERLKETDIVLLPVGQTEQHGQHLPINVDNIICTGIAERVAEATYETAKPVISPTVPFGYSDIPVFRSFPGTFTLEPETLVNVYKDVSKSLIKMGFKKIIFINGHYPNPPFIEEAMRQVTKETGAFFALCNFFVIPDAEVQKILSEMNKPPAWGHACLIETSVSEVFGAEVREDKVVGRIPGGFPKELSNFMPVAPAGITFTSFEVPEIAEAYWGEEGSPGPLGDPVGHSKEIGERVIAATIEPIVKLINDIKDMKVDTSEYLSKLKR